MDKIELGKLAKRIKGAPRHFIDYNGIEILYFPIAPQSDETALAKLGRRVVFYNGLIGLTSNGVMIVCKPGG